jgi:hypothetical protein
MPFEDLLVMRAVAEVLRRRIADVLDGSGL